MYISPRLRGGNRFAGGSLETFAAILGRLQVEWEGVDFVLASFNEFKPRIFIAGCAGGPVCRRLSRDVCGDLVRLQAEREGGDFVLASFQQCYTMYISRRLRGGNRFAGGSLETFAAILLRLQAEREGDNFVLASFNNFTPHLYLPGCAGGTGLTAGL